MSVLDRMNNPIPEDDDARKPPDAGREPRLVPAQLGARRVSLAALLEKVLTAFMAEHAGTPALRKANTETKRLKLILETTNYVLAVESAHPSADVKAELISTAYSELFGYGPLDALFLDERITTIALEGTDKASVRYGHGELTALPPLFEDAAHLQRIIARLLMDAGAELREDQPYLEAGLMVAQRPVCVNVVAPPITLQLTADIRVHPKTPPSLEHLVTQGFMTANAAEFLRALMSSPHGAMIVGDTESGKTTLLSVLSQLLPTPETTTAVERAGELRLPTGVRRLVTRWAVGEQAGVSFGAQIGAALEGQPTCILLDEVRADEPTAITPLLASTECTRQLWSFRGTAEVKRLQSALGMLARRADMAHGEAMAAALYKRLPFVITVRQRESSLQLHSIGEWQFRDNADYPTYTLLMERRDGELVTTGAVPMHTLALSATFWGTH